MNVQIENNQASSRRPIITILGRPNVGKSTLFNRLTCRWASIVEDRPGITRDRLYGEANIGGHYMVLMDTGGLELSPKTKIERKMSAQAWSAVEESDLLLFIFDGRAGVTPIDQEWMNRLRKSNVPKIFVVNKLDETSLDEQLTQFYQLGIEKPLLLSAEKQRNFSELTQEILNALHLKEVEAPAPEDIAIEEELADEDQLTDEDGERVFKKTDDRLFRVAIIGRPNVGKSTTLNAILDQERCIVDDTPGTTRDPIHSDVTWNGLIYRFIDTAGIRRRAKTIERVEKFSVVQSLKMIDEADLVLLLMDSIEGPTDQDAHVAGYAFKKSKAMILVANKWDEGQHLGTREHFEERMELKMNFLKPFPLLFVSAKTKKNLGKIFEVIETIRAQYERRVGTSELNKAFTHIVDHHPLPVYKGQQLKMYYATQVSSKPPTFCVFCNYPKEVHFSYKRYLQNALREIFQLHDVPVRVIFKGRN